MSAAKKPTSKATEAPQDLITAAKSGDRLETLIALRDLLAERLQNTTSGRDVASMSRRLMQAVAEIETLEKLKTEAEENPFSLRDFRKELNKDFGKIQKGYELNGIDREHERY